MFDDDESTIDGDVSSLPKEESDADGEYEVVTPNPEEESLPKIDQVMEDLSFPNMEDEFEAFISPSSSDPQESYQCLDPFGDSKEKSFLLDPEQSKDFHIKGIDYDTSQEYYRLEPNVENVCSKDTLEAANSMSDSKVNDEHESFLLEGTQDTYSFEETPSPLAISTNTESHHPILLHQKNFEKVLVDDFVYHKCCKSRCGLLCKSCS